MRALIVVDVQNDFISGSLPVPDGETIIPRLNEIGSTFDFVVITQDWHPADHKSFASQNGMKPYEVGELNGKPQIMWPDHCVIGTDGAALHPNLDVNCNAFIHKGTNKENECYSGFCDVEGNETKLDSILQEHDITEVFVCGLATDYCVKETALDSVRRGYKTYFLEDVSKGVSHQTVEEAKALMWEAGVTITTSSLFTRLDLEQYVGKGATLNRLAHELNGFKKLEKKGGNFCMRLGKTEIDDLTNELSIQNLREAILSSNVYLYGVQIDVFI